MAEACEPLVKVVNGDLLLHSGAFLNWYFGEWNHHAPHPTPKKCTRSAIATHPLRLFQVALVLTDSKYIVSALCILAGG